MQANAKTNTKFKIIIKTLAKCYLLRCQYNDWKSTYLKTLYESTRCRIDLKITLERNCY